MIKNHYTKSILIIWRKLMPFKGTNREAYKTASKGKNPKERSEIYYKEKSKLERKPSLFSEIKKARFGQKKRI